MNAPQTRGGYLRFVLDTDVITVPPEPGLAWDSTLSKSRDPTRHAGLPAWRATPSSACCCGSPRARRCSGACSGSSPGRRRVPAIPTPNESGLVVSSHGPEPVSLSACGLAVAGIAVVFAVWAVMKPPTQSPDEVDHVVRAVALVKTPGSPSTTASVSLRDSANPLVFPAPPGPLLELFFRSDHQLSTQAVAGLQALRFGKPGRVRRATRPRTHRSTT